jgi:hypothetical protein
MKVGVIQSNYLPWRGYFDLIDEVELFIFYDDVQYTKNDWRNRNRIKTADGAKWLTVPVHQVASDQLICETRLDDTQAWRRKHLKSITQWYQSTPHFGRYYPEFAETLEKSYDSIAALNQALSRWLMRQLAIKTPVRDSREFNLAGKRGARLLDLLQQAGATHYLSGPSAKAYLDEAEFGRQGIQVEYKAYDYAPYPQPWGEFVGDVTALDLLFNTGPEARHYLKSRGRALAAAPATPPPP